MFGAISCAGVVYTPQTLFLLRLRAEEHAMPLVFLRNTFSEQSTLRRITLPLLLRSLDIQWCLNEPRMGMTLSMNQDKGGNMVVQKDYEALLMTLHECMVACNHCYDASLGI